MIIVTLLSRNFIRRGERFQYSIKWKDKKWLLIVGTAIHNQIQKIEGKKFSISKELSKEFKIREYDGYTKTCKN